MFKFNPISALEALRMQQPFQEGEYEFCVMLCESKLSQSGNSMIVAHVDIFSMDGKSLSIKDYILPEHPQMGFKWRDFCVSIGLEKEYESGGIVLDALKGSHGKCIIKHEKEKNGDRMFCKIKSYLKPSEIKTEEHPFNDDITF